MRIICIIQARQTSKRLPGKAKLKVYKKTVLQCVVDRVRAVNFWGKLIDKIVVAIPDTKKNDKLARYCNFMEWEVFRGSEDDVLDRYYKCALKYKADHIVRITGDCPVLEPIIIRALIKEYLEHELDYHALAFNHNLIPPGWDCEIFDFANLERTWARSKKREHVTMDMRIREEYQDYSDKGIVDDRDYLKGISLELNTKQDYRRIKEYGRLISL